MCSYCRKRESLCRLNLGLNTLHIVFYGEVTFIALIATNNQCKESQISITTLFTTILVLSFKIIQDD